MTKKTEYDYLIVGQGIAGTVLSYTLLKEGASVLVVDEKKETSASRVAAGLFNPITGRNKVKTWLADELFDSLFSFYESFEKELGEKFFYPLPIYYPIDSVAHQNDWLAKESSPELSKYQLKNYSRGLYQDEIQGKFGGIELRRSGYLDVKIMLDSYRSFLKQKEAIIETRFDSEDITFIGDKVKWRNRAFHKIIFCSGVSDSQNKYFDWLKFSLVKGEILKIEIKDAELKHIINKNGWLLPLSGEGYVVGATYEIGGLNNLTSEKGKLQLIQKLDKLLRIPYEVKNHIGGIRPATYDRRPFIGLHPEYPQVGIFNGLGSKGVSLAPYFAKHFESHLQKKTLLMKEVDIRRVKGLKLIN